MPATCSEFAAGQSVKATSGVLPQLFSWRAHQANDGETLAAFGQGAARAEVISLDEVRRRRLVRRSFAHGLLNAYELVDEEAAAA